MSKEYSVKIEQMTVDLFEYWLEKDWQHIIKGIYSVPGPAELNGFSYHGSISIKDARPIPLIENDKFSRGKVVPWSTDDPERLNRITTIRWSQLRSDSIVVRFDAGDQLAEQIVNWLKDKFGVE